jgi:hypothetical protein
MDSAVIHAQAQIERTLADNRAFDGLAIGGLDFLAYRSESEARRPESSQARDKIVGILRGQIKRRHAARWNAGVDQRREFGTLRLGRRITIESASSPPAPSAP